MNESTLKKAGFTLAGLYGAAYALKAATVKLEFFKPSEFGLWYPLIDDKLLIGLDEFRRQLDAPVVISPAPGALGRWSSDYKTSQHYAIHGVRALDVLIPEHITLERAYNVARGVGMFSGIGVYPDWQPRHGLHLDTRKDRTPAAPATWAGIKVAGVQVYRSLAEGFA